MLHPLPNHRALKGYYFASSIEEALAYLIAHHGRSQVVGGGTLLMPLLQRDAVRIEYLADVSRIASIRRVTEGDGQITVGGAVTFERLLSIDAIAQRAPILREAAERMSAPQIRQLATLAGNVVAAEGNTQGAVALMALDADVEITNSTGAQWLPIDSLYVSHGVSRVDSSSEVVTALRFPAQAAGQGTALASLPPPVGAYRPLLVLAVNLGLRADAHSVAWGHLVVGSIRSAPARLMAIEGALLTMDPFDPKLPATLGEAIRGEALEKHRLGEAPEAEYRSLAPLAADALSRALDMARRSLRPQGAA